MDPNVFTTGVPIFAYPNPAKNVSSIGFSFSTNRATSMRLKIYNLVGQLVYERAFTSGTGAQTATWNLQNDSGAKIASGLYICRIEGDAGNEHDVVSRKFVVIQ